MPGAHIRCWPGARPTMHTGQPKWRNWRPDDNQNRAYPSRQTVQTGGSTSMNGEGQRHVAIDGKTLRRSFDNFLDRRAAHILSAFASDTALVLAHLDCDEKSNEIPAVQTLLGTLSLTGSVVTVDAMHCQKKPSSKQPPPAFI